MSIIAGNTRFHTRALTGTMTISANASPPVIRATLLVESGTCSVIANFSYDGVSSTAISLAAGQGVEITAIGPGVPMDGITITASGGTTNVILSF